MYKTYTCHRLIILVMVVSLGFAAMAQDTESSKKEGFDMAEFQKLWAAYSTPGEYHKLLVERAGTWDVTVKYWMAPDTEPQVTKAVSEIKLIWEGRYTVEKYEGDAGGVPFSGMGLMGYDNFKKKFIGIWIDSMSTGIMLVESNGDLDGVVTEYITESPDPITSSYKKGKTQETRIDADTRKMVMFDKSPDGKKFLSMEMIYKRRK